MMCNILFFHCGSKKDEGFDCGSISTEAAALAVIINDQHSAMPFKHSIQEGATWSETAETNSSFANVYDLDSTKFWLQFCKKYALGFLRFASLTPALHHFPFVPVLCRSSITALEKKHTEILCARCMKPDAAIQHKIGGSGWDAKAQKTQSGICFRIKSEKL